MLLISSSQDLNRLESGLPDVRALFRGSGIVALGIALKVALTFATEVMAARILLPERYGLITWGLFLANILCMISGLGLNTALRRFLATYRAYNDMGAIRGLIRISVLTTLVTGVIGALLFFLASGWLAGSVFGDNGELVVLQVLVFAIPSWTILKVTLAVFGGFERPFYKVLIEDSFVPLGFFSVVVLAWLADYKEVGIALGYAIIYFVAALLSLYCVRTKTLYRQTLSYKPSYHIREIIKFSWPLILIEPLGKSTGMIDVLIVGVLTVPYQVGIFRAASDMAAAMSIVLMSLAYMYFPIISRLIANGEHEQWKAINARVARWSMLLCFPIFSTFFFFPHEVIQLIYGPHYTEGVPVLRILALAYFGYAMVGFTGLNLIAKGMTGLQLIASFIALTTNIAGNYLLIPIYGLKGAAVASLLSLWGLNFFCLIFMKIRLKLQPFTPMYGKSLGTLVLTATALSFVIHRSGTANGMISIFIFLSCILGAYTALFFLGVFVDETDILLIKSTLRRMIFFRFKREGH